MLIFATPRAVALTISLALHAVLIILVILNKFGSDHQVSFFTNRKEAQVIMLPPRASQIQAHGQQTVAQPQPQSQQAPSQAKVPEKVALLAPPVFSEDEEEQITKSMPAPLGSDKGKSKSSTQQESLKPHSFARARSSWANQESPTRESRTRESPSTQELTARESQNRESRNINSQQSSYQSHQTAYTEKDGIATSFGKALAYHPNFNAMAGDQTSETAHGTKDGLTTVVNQEFKDFKTRQYISFIGYSIGYELNKQGIHEAPCDVPRRLVVQINLAASGKLLNMRILASDGMPDFNQAVLRAIQAASPFRSFPAYYKEPNLTVTFTLTPDPSVLAQPNSRLPIPISFFVSNPYES